MCIRKAWRSKHSFPTMYGQVPKTCRQSGWPGAAAEGSIPHSRSFSLSKKSNNLLLFLEIQERNLLENRHDTENFQLSCQSHFQVIFKSVRAEDKIGLPNLISWSELFQGLLWTLTMERSGWIASTVPSENSAPSEKMSSCAATVSFQLYSSSIACRLQWMNSIISR